MSRIGEERLGRGWRGYVLESDRSLRTVLEGRWVGDPSYELFAGVTV
jgi:hypothetical protein